MKYKEIKRFLLAYWKQFNTLFPEIFRTYQDVLNYQKRQIYRINNCTDLIDLRDIICEFYNFANKTENESFLEFRHSGKEIDLFTLKKS